jgi:diaminopimelate epimerase
MNLQFTKMEGIGNDFVVVDCLVPNAPSETELQAASERLCDRKFGIGGDGVLLVLPSETADFKMRMFNPDGTEAEMCGNGIRCFAKFAFDAGHSAKRTLSVETLAGTMLVELAGADASIDGVRVDMGIPVLDRAELPMVGASGRVLAEPVEVAGETVTLTGVSMGNPHVVFFAEDASDALIDRLGPPLEKHSLFPRRTNVHAVQILGPSEIKMLTWERGAGRTLACGTGACACAVASALNGLTGRTVLAHLPGGDLKIEWGEDDHVYMTGPATHVFTGVMAL